MILAAIHHHVQPVSAQSGPGAVAYAAWTTIALGYFLPSIIVILRRSLSHSPSMSTVGIVLVVDGLAGWTVIGWFAALILSFTEMSQPTTDDARESAPEEDQWQRSLHEFTRMDLIPRQCPDLLLRRDETCYFVASAQEVKLVTQNKRVGGYSGPSFRIARGVYWRVGGFTSRTIGTTRPQAIDSGTLYLTNARAVFTGSTGTAEFRYDKLASYELYNDGMRLDMPNKPFVVFVTGDPYTGWTFARLKDGLIKGMDPAGVKTPAVQTSGVAADPAPVSSSSRDGATHTESKSAQELPNAPLLSTQAHTSRAIAKVVASQLRDHISLLSLEYRALDSTTVQTGKQLSLPESALWLRAKLAALEALVPQVMQLVVAELGKALSVPNEEQAKIAAGHWLHKCDTICYSMVDWEKDARSTGLPPQLDTVHAKLIGQTSPMFSEIEALPDKLDHIASGTAGTEPGSGIKSTLSGDRLAALNAAIDDAARSITPP